MITKPSIQNVRYKVWLVLLALGMLPTLMAQISTSPQQHLAYRLLAQADSATTEDCIILCSKAVEALNDNNNRLLHFNIYKKAGITLYDQEQHELAQSHLLKALKYADVINDKKELGSLYEYLGWTESKATDHEKAITYFLQAERVFKSSGELNKLGSVYNGLGAMYWYLRNYTMALEYFERVVSSGEKTDNTVLLCKGLTNKGVVLHTLAQYNEALICLERALELSQLDNNTRSRAILLNNIGNIYGVLNKPKAAIQKYNDALKIYATLADQNGISSCYNNLGEAYLKQGNILQAIENYHTSLSIFKEQGDSASMAVSYVNIGRAHQKGQQYSKAISYFKKAIKLMLSFDDPSLKAETYLHLGQTLMVNNLYDSALDYLNKAEALALSLDEKALLADCYNSLSEWYKMNNDYREALNYKTQYAEIKTAITDEQALLSSARMEAAYKLPSKEEQISMLAQDNINKTERLQLALHNRSIYFIIMGVLLSLLFLLFLSYRSRQRAERKLKQANMDLQQLNATKDKFFSIIAHDLKSPFSSLMGFAEMLMLNAESKNTKAVIEYSQIIHNSTKRLLGLVENLLQWSRTQLGTTEYRPTQLDISIQTHNIVSLLRLNAEEKDIVISPRIERNLVAWADENLYNTVLRNLISNAIKFSRIGSVIYVTAGIKNNMIEISVADSGVGIRQENLEKLFMADATFSTKGTLNEKGTGLGLVLCKEFVEINKGEIWAESELEKGSTFYFTLPLLHEHKNK
ncbi:MULTISPECIES: tetratricopeptide repeat protein [unclassified Carboxylicivirga]|uniref:tetratricopeptide repeat-containing sensor histidine kinase n=1 Tax=Carboxylicivirga TaxID=1628153 RepID=UPI003D3573B1